jgi:hypothetical protein
MFWGNKKVMKRGSKYLVKKPVKPKDLNEKSHYYESQPSESNSSQMPKNDSIKIKNEVKERSGK